MHRGYAKTHPKISFHIFKRLLDEKGGEGGNVRRRGGAQKTRSACRGLDLLTEFLLINTTYYPRNPSSRPELTLGRRAHFGALVRRSP